MTLLEKLEAAVPETWYCVSRDQRNAALERLLANEVHSMYEELYRLRNVEAAARVYLYQYHAMDEKGPPLSTCLPTIRAFYEAVYPPPAPVLTWEEKIGVNRNTYFRAGNYRVGAVIIENKLTWYASEYTTGWYEASKFPSAESARQACEARAREGKASAG